MAIDPSNINPSSPESESSPHPRTCGFRFSATDAGAILVCLLLSILGIPYLGVGVLLFPYVLGHFFLFCNIFRIRRVPELIWAGTFLLSYLLVTGPAGQSMLWAFLAQLPVTFIILLYEIRQPSYHGIFARTWNAEHIDEYLRGELPK